MPGDARSYRISTIDLVRGLAIVIMALDHCRDYFLAGSQQDPMANPDVTLAVYLTRWVTHFCAPVFVLLAGTSVGLMQARRSSREIARFVLARGLWLIALEATIISCAWTFHPGPMEQAGGRYLLILQVIWALGASMVVLSGAQFLGRRACLVIGIAIVFGHNLLDFFWPVAQGTEALPTWAVLHSRLPVVAGPVLVYSAYPVLPWIGVMLAGFGASGVFELAAPERKRLLVRAGLAMIALFFVLRLAGFYGDPHPWRGPGVGLLASAMSFFNTAKYPPSLEYLLMTLGPAALLLSVADRIGGAVRGFLETLGRVPFAFYVLHLYLIHVLALLLGVAQGFPASGFLVDADDFPRGYGVPLWGVYVAWVLVVALLWPACRFMAGVKRRRKDWWLSYL